MKSQVIFVKDTNGRRAKKFITLCTSEPVLLRVIHKDQQKLPEDHSMPTFSPFMLTFRCKPRIAAWCHGRAAQKQDREMLRTLTPMQYYVK